MGIEVFSNVVIIRGYKEFCIYFDIEKWWEDSEEKKKWNGTAGERCWKQKLKEGAVFILEETNQKGNFFVVLSDIEILWGGCSSAIFISWKSQQEADFLASLDLFCSFSTFKTKIRPKRLLQPCLSMSFSFSFFACLSQFNKHLLRNYSMLVIVLGSRDLKMKKTQSLPSRSSLTALGSSFLCACLLLLLEDETPEYSFASAVVQPQWLIIVGLTDVGWIK